MIMPSLRFNRDVRARRNEFLASAAAAVSICALLSSSVPNLNGASLLFLERSVVIYLVAALIFAGFGWWSAHTVSVLWRSGRNPWERLVYNFGVRLFGLTVAIALVLICGWLGWSNENAAGDRWWWLAAGILCGMVLAFPIGLYMGYFWGTTVAMFYGVERDASNKVCDPPSAPHA